MTDNKAPIIKPIKLKQYECKQSNYEIAPELPMRSLILSPSGGGKTVMLVNMIMDIYKGCFNRIYIFSPNPQFPNYTRGDQTNNRRVDLEHCCLLSGNL